MLAEPARTAYDLNFRLFGFHVRVHPLFWLAAILLGASTLDTDNDPTNPEANKYTGLPFLLIWVIVVFVSILVHEMGHALAFRRFGTDSHIVLWIFGGLAVPYSAVGGRWRRIIVSLAGPIAGFMLLGLVYGSDRLTNWSMKGDKPVAFLYFTLIFVNLYWGILNLLPVFPLDGGQVSRELCEMTWRTRGLRLALQISIGVAALIAIYSLACATGSLSGPLAELPWWFPRGSFYTAILFAMLAVQSYMLLQQIGPGMYYEAPDDRVPWER